MQFKALFNIDLGYRQIKKDAEFDARDEAEAEELLRLKCVEPGRALTTEELVVPATSATVVEPGEPKTEAPGEESKRPGRKPKTDGVI